MQLRDLEKALRAEAEAAKVKADARDRWRPRGILRRLTQQKPESRPQRDRRDLVIAGLGVTLGLCCALFPWYIFMNPDKFGVRAMTFEGNGAYEAPVQLGSTGERIGAPISTAVISPTKLDLFVTGTVKPEEEGQEHAAAPADQPFPGAAVSYRMVYAASGRAMIADDSGYWVVQRGSVLPDNSTVSSIEQRKGAWVLITSEDRLVELSTE